MSLPGAKFRPSDDLEDLHAEDPDISCAANQVVYNLSDRVIEWDLYPKCRCDKVAVMAYCSLGQGSLLDNPGLAPPAKKDNAIKAAIVLEKRIMENAAPADLVRNAEDLKSLGQIFPPPREKLPLAIT